MEQRLVCAMPKCLEIGKSDFKEGELWLAKGRAKANQKESAKVMVVSNPGEELIQNGVYPWLQV